MTFHPHAAGARLLVLGEVLWDRFPDCARLGGAALNFAVHVKRLGHVPRLMSAVGADPAGEEAKLAIERLGLETTYLQSTAQLNTGTAAVHLGPSGRTSFTIERPAAYDAVELSEDGVEQIARWNPAWLYFGTLFPSCPSSRRVLDHLLQALPASIRFYDLNLRPGFESPELVGELIRQASVVKLNERELQFVHQFIDLPPHPEEFCRVGSRRYGWRAASVTLGARGCAMMAGDDYVEVDGFPVEVADTVGAGDAFAAAFVHGLASNWPAAAIAEFSNRVGALVAGVRGAIPDTWPDDAFAG